MMTQAVLQTVATLLVIKALFFSPYVAEPHFYKQSILGSNTLSPTPTNFLYTVVPGDSLASIARRFYGNEAYWVTLWNDNPEISDPSILFKGMKLYLRPQKPTGIEKPNRPLPSPSPTPLPVPSKIESEALSRAHVNSRSFDEVYRQAGEKYGVPWQILSALHFLETGRRDGPISSGYGPQGPMQFLPTTFAAYAVDGDGDGLADINNAIDAIHTAANYLARHGSIDAGLRSYGNNYKEVKQVAQSLGWNP
jgi:hypothetical protein